MNIELLNRIRAEVLKEPTQFNMYHWILHTEESNCGTAGCIAGFATTIAAMETNPWVNISTGYKAWMATGQNVNNSIMDRATDLLEIDKWQAYRLFYTPHWPKEFRDAYHDGNRAIGNGNKCGYLMRAKATSDRIKHFIATNGEE